MSGIATICELADHLEESCGFDSYKHIPFGGPLGFGFRCGFTVMDYFPLIITIGKMIIGAVIGSVALYLGGIALFLDLMVNNVLQSIIKHDGPKPCVVLDAYQMPAMASQTATFFVMGFVLFCIIYRRILGTYLLWSVYILGYLAVYKRVFDRVNTVQQLMAGSAIGFVDSLIMHLLLYYWIQYLVPDFCDTGLAKLMGAKNYCFVGANRDLDKLEEDWYTPGDVSRKMRREAEQSYYMTISFVDRADMDAVAADDPETPVRAFV